MSFSHTDVVKAGLERLRHQRQSPAALAESLGLVGWFDRSEADHALCAGFFAAAPGPLISCWPVLTEVCHLVPTDVPPGSGWPIQAASAPSPQRNVLDDGS